MNRVVRKYLVILVALSRQQYNVTSTARALGLERSHLYKKAEQLGIDMKRREEESRNR